MKALVFEAIRQIAIRECPFPIPEEDEVIVQVHTAGICGSDIHGFMGITGRRAPPLIMGHEFAGEIVAVGDRVPTFLPGQRVAVHPLVTCGLCFACQTGRPNICPSRQGIGIDRSGGFAEAVAVPSSQLYILPDHLTWQKGAMVEPLAVALHAISLAPLSEADSILILGAGPIGLLILLCARRVTTSPIIVVDRNKHRLARAAKLGATFVYHDGDDLKENIAGEFRDEGVAVVFEVVGVPETARQSTELVRNGGHIIWVGNTTPEFNINMQNVVARELTIQGSYGFHREFEQAIICLEDETLPVLSLIDHVGTLEDGPLLFHHLGHGIINAVKVMLQL